MLISIPYPKDVFYKKIETHSLLEITAPYKSFPGFDCLWFQHKETVGVEEFIYKSKTLKVNIQPHPPSNSRTEQPKEFSQQVNKRPGDLLQQFRAIL